MSARVSVLAAVALGASAGAAEVPPRETFQAYFNSVCGANRARKTVDGLQIDVRLVPSYQCYLCLEKAVESCKEGETPDLEVLRECYWQGRLLGKQAALIIGLRNTRFKSSSGLRTVYFWRKHPNRDTFTIEGKARILMTRLIETPKAAREGRIRTIRSFRGKGDDMTPVYGRSETLHLVEDEAVEYRMLIPLDRLEREREKELVVTISGISSYYGPFIDDTMNGVHNPARELAPIQLKVPLPIREIDMPASLLSVLAEIDKNPPKQ
ncbi:MAG: hypothetical protein JXP34_12590 [Planctomycetes bacterium]|nr:hypothetical protein [Planctomycetota bacterium]